MPDPTDGPNLVSDSTLPPNLPDATSIIVEEFRLRFPEASGNGELPDECYPRLRDLVLNDANPSVRFAAIAYIDYLADRHLMPVEQMIQAFTTLKIVLKNPDVFEACGDLSRTDIVNLRQRAFEAAAMLMGTVEERGTQSDLERMIQESDAAIKPYAPLIDRLY